MVCLVSNFLISNLSSASCEVLKEKYGSSSTQAEVATVISGMTAIGGIMVNPLGGLLGLIPGLFAKDSAESAGHHKTDLQLCEELAYGWQESNYRANTAIGQANESFERDRVLAIQNYEYSLREKLKVQELEGYSDIDLEPATLELLQQELNTFLQDLTVMRDTQIREAQALISRPSLAELVALFNQEAVTVPQGGDPILHFVETVAKYKYVCWRYGYDDVY